MKPHVNLNHFSKDLLKVAACLAIGTAIRRLGDTDACMYLIDGFCKDELMQKILQYLMELKAEDFPKDAHEMSKIAIPYVEVDLDDTWEKILGALLSGVFVLLLDG